ncbi:MAG TPA: hypothetical protein VIV60_16940 [Polyangiaceae bacterium]
MFAGDAPGEKPTVAATKTDSSESTPRTVTRDNAPAPPPLVELDSKVTTRCKQRPFWIGGLRIGSALDLDVAAGGALPFCEEDGHGLTGAYGVLLLGAVGLRGFQVDSGLFCGVLGTTGGSFRVPLFALSFGPSLLLQLRGWKLNDTPDQAFLGVSGSVTLSVLTFRLGYYPKLDRQGPLTISVGIGF